jgi:hypothetical protein
MIASTPRPPYYAVIFTLLRTEGDHGYDAMAQRMDDLAAQQTGRPRWYSDDKTRIAKVERDYGLADSFGNAAAATAASPAA